MTNIIFTAYKCSLKNLTLGQISLSDVDALGNYQVRFINYPVQNDGVYSYEFKNTPMLFEGAYFDFFIQFGMVLGEFYTITLSGWEEEP